MSSYKQESNGGVSTTVNEKASGVYTYAQRSLDRVVLPENRQKAYDITADFARERPVVFSFLLSQFIFSFLPILTFATFAISTVAFALGTAIIFSLFWIGVALMLLVPTILVTFSIAVLVWGWAIGSFLIARWLYNHAPFGVQGDLVVDAAGKRVTVYKEGQTVDGSVQDMN